MLFGCKEPPLSEGMSNSFTPLYLTIDPRKGRTRLKLEPKYPDNVRGHPPVIHLFNVHEPLYHSVRLRRADDIGLDGHRSTGTNDRGESHDGKSERGPSDDSRRYGEPLPTVRFRLPSTVSHPTLLGAALSNLHSRRLGTAFVGSNTGPGTGKARVFVEVNTKVLRTGDLSVVSDALISLAASRNAWYQVRCDRTNCSSFGAGRRAVKVSRYVCGGSEGSDVVETRSYW